MCKAALQAVGTSESALQGFNSPAGRRGFNGSQIVTVGLNRQHNAGAHRLAIEQQRAGTHTPCSQPSAFRSMQILADEVAQKEARLDLASWRTPFTMTPIAIWAAIGCRGRLL